MADAFSTLLQLIKMETGNNNNNWGVLLNTQVVDRVEQAIAGSTALAVTGGTTTLTDDQSRSAVITITGALTSESIIDVPARAKSWMFYNGTTGNFPVNVRVAGQTAKFSLPRSALQTLWTDGSALFEPAPGQVPVGSTTFHMGSTIPANFAEMNGQALSRALYPRLFTAIGTTWGTGDGSTTFNVPNAQDRYLRGKSVTYGLGYLAQDVQSHAHTATSDPQGGHGHTGAALSAGSTHNHAYTRTTIQVGNQFPAGSGWGFTTSTVDTATDGSHAHTLSVDAVGNHSHNITVNATGGTETRPNSLQGIACIRIQ